MKLYSKKMRIKSRELIEQLIAETRKVSEYAGQLKSFSSDQLNYRESNDSWSVLECLQHLNLYGRFYLPEITRRMDTALSGRNSRWEDASSGYFKSGILGNYFAKSMLPKAKLNKMKTFKEMNPIHSKLDRSVIDEFLDQQTEMQDLLNRALNVDLIRTKVSISLSRWIKLRLGDTFRFVIYHNMRHMEQVKRVISHQL